MLRHPPSRPWRRPSAPTIALLLLVVLVVLVAATACGGAGNADEDATVSHASTYEPHGLRVGPGRRTG